ncbi:Protein CBG06722 [Caenorhabditis briggsae]|uniref:Protein CBG06722 n=1 Tax=Caenorhabditis briggsae TaxID=6238 RepID=A8X2Y3_CAEBR|nr:Protein CBG06722 [Caenorhabditis briggsae]CAP26993.2 Protein CBG06722 [Caenorhabditis briggsae]
MYTLFQILFIVFYVDSIPVDNSLFGDVQLECDSRTISIQIKTEKPFVGTIFVKDFASEPICVSRGNGRLSAFLEFEIGLCGALRQKILNPKGTVVQTTVTISFHPYFITKIDRSYNLLCLYKESHTTVGDNIEVAEISTARVNETLTLPDCTYQILDGGPFGEPVHFGLIGRQVYHQWKCESSDDDSFCMVVHTCSADDGKGDRAFLIDSNGCAIDKFLLSDLEYPENLLAGQEAHVYKFADRDTLFFQCQISITVREPGVECVRPICSEDRPEGGGAPVGSPPYGPAQKKSVKFNTRSKRSSIEHTMDVRTRFSVGNVFEKPSNQDTCVLLSSVSIPCLLMYVLIIVITFLISIVLIPESSDFG